MDEPAKGGALSPVASDHDVLPDRHDLVLAVPEPTEHVRHDQAHRCLDQMAPITVVEALPGFGKTTQVAAWSRDQQRVGARVVWMRCSPMLDGAAAFLAAMYDGLRRVRVVGETSELGSSQSPGRVLTSSPEQPVILVLDDIHRLTRPEVVDIPVRLAARVMGFHVVGCAAAPHHLWAAASRYGLETNSVLGTDLTVTAAQLVDIAATWGHDLTLAQSESLERMVGGWLQPLRLLLDATGRWGGSATDSTLEFLARSMAPWVSDHTMVLATASRMVQAGQLTDDVVTSLLHSRNPSESTEVEVRIADGLRRHGLLWRAPGHHDRVEWQVPTLLRDTLIREMRS